MDELKRPPGCLNEMAFALDTLNADGVALASSYGHGQLASKFPGSQAVLLRAYSKLIEYVGDDLYDPIWRELDRRGAIVFLHGTQTPSSTPCPHPLLGIPITEVYISILESLLLWGQPLTLRLLVGPE